ncbi:hypothetical protein N7450_004370 [Penicillium hetheringtonii]|uniref:Ubiquitin carboxyl-terminal hydrolase 19 n=1 Tax=Penicillium hetheringtonii TaxID=911720 RepID=A0AAD6GUC1_9EURO|nr:hypothetical protein N7450_004370 [Penicillium hetheringtonii]
MDAQYPFASRDDIWRVFEELKELRVGQFEQSERLGRLERRRDEDARMRNVWGSSPLSPFPTSVGGSLATETVFNSPPDAFKGFDQGQHQGMASSAVGLDGEDEPRRGASRANSVRFDESAIHGYYGQTGRSSTDLPLRTGSGLGSHPLIERSLSHRSDGRQSSSGQSHHSARTNSLGLDTSRLMGSSSFGGSPLTTPPAGLFLLGPVPCIIRCWLTNNFSNESLLYAAVCSGSYVSSVGASLLHKLGLETEVTQEDGQSYAKLPFYLPEASIYHQSSSRPSSPEPRLPSLTIRFLVRESNDTGDSIQIIIGSDVLRSHNADILFSQDKINMVDDERNRLSVPLVRLKKTPSHMEPPSDMNGNEPVGVIGQPTHQQSSSAPASARVSIGEINKPTLQTKGDSASDAGIHSTPTTASDTSSVPGSKSESGGPWSSWRRDSKPDSSKQEKEKRPMKVLRPAKASSRVNSSTSTPTAVTNESVEPLTIFASESSRASNQTPRASSDGSHKPRSSNPVGGASAFGWLNPGAPASMTQAFSQSK